MAQRDGRKTLTQFNQALRHFEVGRLPEAKAACRALLAGKADPELLAKLASSLLDAGRPEEAAAAVRQALGRCPGHLALAELLGSILLDLSRFEEAAAVFREALARHPAAPKLHAGLGLALMKLGRIDEAIAAYGAAAAHAPDRAAEWLAEANHQMALVLRAQGRLEAAVAALEQAIALCPTSAEAHNNLGVMLKDLGRTGDAVRCFRRAIELNPHYAPAYSNLGGALRDLERLDEAFEVLKIAIELAPEATDGHGNLGLVMHDLGRIEEARALYDRVVSACQPKDPKFALARFNLSAVLLLNGDLATGFAEYEWRRKGGVTTHVTRTFEQPEWQGEDLAGRTILLHAEQGLGDTLQFCRYVPLVQARGGRVVLQAQPPLVPLLAAAFPEAVVLDQAAPLPAFDCHHPLMSLPWRLGTTLDTIPAATPYFAADPVKLAAWRERLKSARGLKVGLVWAGNPKTRHDRLRSLSAGMLLPHLPAEGVTLFSLQKELRPGDAEALAAHGGVTDLAPLLGDFSDTAAAVSALDLVISIDSAVAHLAGALHRPTWLLLPYALDWRWLRDRADSPWYPSVRLFRQSAPRQWPDALTRLGEALRLAAGANPATDTAAAAA